MSSRSVSPFAIDAPSCPPRSFSSGSSAAETTPRESFNLKGLQFGLPHCLRRRRAQEFRWSENQRVGD
jgi:hypothetical protein